MQENLKQNPSIQEKPFLNALNGQVPTQVPLWFMRQAGRYLPEYRKLRSSKNGFLDMAFDPNAAIEITMQPIRRFGMDAAILFSDILVIPYALGQKLEFAEGEGPKLEPLRSAENLNFDHFETTLAPIYKTVSGVRNTLASEGFNEIALIGFAGSPWTVATYMIEGGGSKDFAAVKSLAYSDPEKFAQLIDVLCEATARYLIKQAEAGAEVLQLFDSWAGVLDPQQFERWVIQPTAKIVRSVKEKYPDIPIIGFPRGAAQNYEHYVHETKIDAVGLDSQLSTSWAANILQPIVPVQGNLDPMCLLAGGDALKRGAEKILSDLSSGPFVFNLGHGIHKDTPVSHVEDLIQIVRNYSA